MKVVLLATTSVPFLAITTKSGPQAMVSLGFKMFNIVFMLVIISYSNAQFNYVGQFEVYSVGFMSIDRFNVSSPYQFLSTAFGFFEGDGFYYVSDIGSQYRKGINNTNPNLVTSDLSWPNEAEMVPQGAIVGSPYCASVADGFLAAPGQTTGSINIFTWDGSQYSSNPVQLSTDKSGWFYHRVRWYDVNHDGRLDIITARATKPIFGSSQGELLWLEQPPNGLQTAPWPEHHIVGGPDVFFELFDTNGDNVPEIFAAQYFSQQLTVYYTNTDWTDPTQVNSVIIDNTVGPLFDLRFVDVNNDGKTDLVATNNVQTAALASVFAYEFPSNWKTDPWPRHILASGFQDQKSGTGTGAPGSITPFYPTKDTSGRPWFLLACDDGEAAYQLAPSGSDWGFSTTLIVSPSATVGPIVEADLNGDGYKEFFVPAYDTSIVYVYTYGPTMN
eukprot:TRINITY_DN6000_c0_g1_i1.p1 TRINITY_DN6000_c0_g1~~TRINITY_DN6000_c0_g1_i1.p1  ORF type:complete len:444 (-),score=111.92 TRINITY_DN6000_c0_g1_i1:32-1363(-)